MRKFNIKLCIMAITAAVLLTASIIVFAAFSYKKNIVSPDVTVGDVLINEKKFLSYAKDRPTTNPETQEYYRLCKLRTDSYAYVEGITISTSYYPATVTSSTFVGGEYYIKENDIYKAAQAYDSTASYYTRVDNMSVKSGGAYDANNALLDTEVSNNQITLKVKDTTTVVEVLTLTVTDRQITAVTLQDEENHRCVIGSDGLSVYIFTQTAATVSTEYTTDSITCYASERKKNDTRIDYSLPYLNQLGLKFTFTTKIPVYVRIHIQDAWISTQFLSSQNERIRYISKAQISGASPFNITDSDWYYDVAQNVAYYRGMFEPVKDANGNFTEQSYVFNVNEGYFYHDTSAQAASKVTTVQVSFTVDIVQANRAEALWGVDFDELFA